MPPALEELLDRFEEAWQSGRPLALEAVVAGVSTSPERQQLLVELIPIDLEYRWRLAAQGESDMPSSLNMRRSGRPYLAPEVLQACPRVEDYLARFPELVLAANLIAEEYRVRRRWGDRPAADAVVRRFPKTAHLREALLRIDAELAYEFPRAVRDQGGDEPAVDPTRTPTTLAIETMDEFVDVVRINRLLAPAQLAEVTELTARFTRPQALARHLLERDWLSAFQVNQIFRGRGPDLVLGSYQLTSRLGSGSTGQVFKARHTHLRRDVALKVIRNELLSEPEVLQRFYREIEAVSRVSHPNVVHAFDAGPVGDNHVLVMEYVEGTDLARLVRQHGPLPVEQAVDYARQVALGLEHIRACGLVHRDIKPSNLLVTPAPGTTSGGLVKILDLGLAQLHQPDGGRSPFTQVGTVMGTPDYLAPEQAIDSSRVDSRADLYSLGCTLYFLLTGQVPFPGGTVGQKLIRHQQDDFPAVTTLRVEVSMLVEEVLRRMTAKKPAARFQTPAEAALALAAILEARPEPVTERSAVPVSTRPNRFGRMVRAVAAFVSSASREWRR